MTDKLPRWAGGAHPLTPEEFVYCGPPVMGRCITVDRDELERLLARVHELEALAIANEHNMKVSIEVDGQSIEEDAGSPGQGSHAPR